MGAAMKQRLAGLLIILLLQTTLATAADDIPLGVMRINGLDAPELKLDSIDGDPYDLSTTGGHWRFVHFWASWCGPCRREMPSIQRMMPLLEDTDLEFVIVNTAETEDAVFEFLGIVAPELVPLMDTDGTVTPDDAGLTWAIAKSKPDFVGIRGLMRPDLVAALKAGRGEVPRESLGLRHAAVTLQVALALVAAAVYGVRHLARAEPEQAHGDQDVPGQPE